MMCGMAIRSDYFPVVHASEMFQAHLIRGILESEGIDAVI